MNHPRLTDARTPEALLNELRALVAEAELMLNDGGDGDGAEVVTTMRARFDAAQEQLTALCAGVRKNVAAGARHADEAIRANPYQSLAIALGAGLLLGIVLGRRSKDFSAP